MENLVVISKQVAKIEWNKEQALKEAQEIMARYDGIEFTEEQLPIAKKEIAALRKVSKEINSQAIAIDKELTAPVKEFRTEVKEVKEIVDNGINHINEQIKAFEEKQKQDRFEQISEFDEFKELEKTGYGFDEAWLKKSWSDTKLKKLFIELVQTYEKNVSTIKLMCEKNGLESEFYINKLQVDEIDEVIIRIMEDAENLHKKEETKEVVEIDLDEPQTTIKRKLTGTVTQLKMLKEYADKIGVKWSE